MLVQVAFLLAHHDLFLGVDFQLADPLVQLRALLRINGWQEFLDYPGLPVLHHPVPLLLVLLVVPVLDV